MLKKRARKNHNKRIFTVLLLLMVSLMLEACSPKSYTADTNTIFPQKKGAVVQVLVSDFDKDYYDKDELMQYIENAVMDFQQVRGEESMFLRSCEVEDKTVRVRLDFATSKDYSLFNEQTLFCGTIAEALEEGYSFDSDFYTVEENQKTEEVVKSEILEKEKYHVVIIDHSTWVELPGRLRYIGGDAAIIHSKKQVEITEKADSSKNLMYLIYK